VAVFARFSSFDDVVEQANRLPYGLAAYIFTESAKRAMLMGDAIESGMVGINQVLLAAADAPFGGGVKESGHGAEDGPVRNGLRLPDLRRFLGRLSPHPVRYLTLTISQHHRQQSLLNVGRVRVSWRCIATIA
jgi:hypothetical protein